MTYTFGYIFPLGPAPGPANPRPRSLTPPKLPCLQTRRGDGQCISVSAYESEHTNFDRSTAPCTDRRCGLSTSHWPLSNNIKMIRCLAFYSRSTLLTTAKVSEFMNEGGNKGPIGAHIRHALVKQLTTGTKASAYATCGLVLNLTLIHASGSAHTPTSSLDAGGLSTTTQQFALEGQAATSTASGPQHYLDSNTWCTRGASKVQARSKQDASNVQATKKTVCTAVGRGAKGGAGK